MLVLKYLKYIVFSATLLVIFSLIFGFYVLWKFSPQLPSYEKIINYKPKLSSRIYSSDGLLLKSFYLEERIYIPIDRIPYSIKNAFISAEDKNFYNHKGIDLVAIFRAIITNIIQYKSGKRVVGASTITQQVVKNLLLSNELSYSRKIKEIILAIRIENILSKDEILELYLNDIYLGFGSYGVGTASLNYFNKSIYNLELHEIAYLASLPKAPNNYNPFTNYKSAITRRDWVIDRLFENNYIKKSELDFKNKPLKVYERSDNLYSKADYYYEEIRKNLFNTYGKNQLYSEGLVIKTSIDSNIQNYADESLVEGIIQYDKRQGWRGSVDNVSKKFFINNISIYNEINPLIDKWLPVIISDLRNKSILAHDHLNKKYLINLNYNENKWLENKKFDVGDVIFIEQIDGKKIIRQIPNVNGAIVVIDPHNGDVLALSGGFSFKKSEFNRATQAKRQPGSAFKPFVYLAALSEGYTPATLILDAPYVVDQGPGLPKWKPANYTEEFYGLTTMRTGIEKSRNLMTVRLADRIGMNKILKIIRDFGISDGMNSQLSMSLGSGLVSLLDITNAYAIIANGGTKINPKLIKSIYSKNGKKIYNSNQKYCENCKLKKFSNKIEIPKIYKKNELVIDSKIAYQITSMMEGVIKRGTAKSLKELDVPIAGKTGTTNDNKDAWFIGYTPNLTIGVYIGYDQPKSLGYKQTGSSVAVPIFKRFAEKTNINVNNVPFKIPSGVSFVKIDPNSGLPSNKEGSILEPFILGSEPYTQNVNIIDNLSNINNNSISGTGALLE